jgi:signal transduction histidine kinase/CheY-like chemotaxis protein
MNGSAYYIEKYFRLKRTSRLNNVIEQVDRISVLARQALNADFVVLFYEEPATHGLMPVSCACCEAEIRDLGSLEAFWLQRSHTGERVERVFMSTQDFDMSAGGGHDLFARANGFRCSYVYPHYVSDTLRSVLVAYWTDQPTAVKPDTENVLAVLVQMLDGVLVLAHDLKVIDSYSQKLSDLIGIFDWSIGDLSFSELISQVVKRAQAIAPVEGVSLFSENRKTRLLEPRETAGNVPRPDFPDGLTQKINAVFKSAARPGAGERWQEMTSDFADVCSGVVAIEISPDAQWRFVLASWTQSRPGFSPDDLEILSIYALSVKTILGNALLVRSLRKTNRVLKKSSARLANFETLAALADMTSGLAHDLNNMIGGVVGRLQLVKMKCQDQPTLAGLNKIEELVMEGAHTIKRIQEFVTGTRYKSLEPVDLKGIVSRALANPDSLWKKVAATRQVAVVPLYPPEPAIVNGFEPDLATAVEKLLENAVEHSPEKAVVEVAVGVDKQACTISVADLGAGVPDKIKDKIFYPFFTTKTVRGAGMSLATVHGIAVRHGGSIKYSRDAEKGTIFTLRLEQAHKTDEVSDITRKIKLPTKLAVLVVDDDAQIREILNDMLAMEGHEATTCPDGYAALRALEKREYDLMITDLGMPGMSGLDLAGAAHDSHPAMPIAMITGWGTQLDHSEVKSKGIRTILAKPFHLKDVRAILESLATH